MSDPATIRAQAARLRDAFVDAGARAVEAPLLLSADTLLDLYGEDIRARAYVTDDPERGEMMLRPDFTVPVVQMHMASGGQPQRYTYAGEVFRKQQAGSARASEYLQVGYEVFDSGDPVRADAEVFARIAGMLDGLPLRAVTGDIGILRAAVETLGTTPERRAALLRHIWRPGRFRVLLDRFTGRLPVPAARQALLEAVAARGVDALLDEAGPEIGRRGRAEIAARLDLLSRDADTPPIPAAEADTLTALLALSGPMPQALAALRDLARDLPGIETAVARFEARMAALSEAGIDVADLPFEASYGRTNMEYYDGFVFGFLADGARDLAPVATGGRYDALTRVLGEGEGSPAVGAVIRPDLMLGLEGAA